MTQPRAPSTRQWPPLIEVRRSMRVKWYRSPIDKPTLWKLMERSNRRGFQQSLGHLGLIVGLAAVVAVSFESGWWAVFGVSLWLLGTIASFVPGLSCHELVHGTVFRTNRLNRIFLRVFSLYGWFNYNEYRMSHTFHHRYTLFPDGDREVLLPKEASLHPLVLLEMFTINIRGALRLLKSTVQMAMGKFDMDTPNSIGGAGSTAWTWALSEVHPQTYRAAVNWARFTLAFHGTIIVLSIVFQLWWLMIVVSGAIFIGSWWKYFIAQTQHAGLRDNVPDFRLCTRSVKLDPVSSFLYWHMEKHIEHHMFAGVPCYNLKALTDEIADDLPKPRSLISAWREMRYAWNRQQSEPDYQYNTPLPATANPGMTSEDAVTRVSDGIEASIGTLDPDDDQIDPRGTMPVAIGTLD
ncbi:MAG: fatty acid desaturase [Chloroflexi bacterium]|nr:fatty acid desaturase [Chloroflexota bacterium]